jgi:hypothetical protein
MTFVIASCVAWTALAGCTSSEDGAAASRKRCVTLRDHLVELRLQGAGVDEVAAHRAAMQQALGDRFVEQCMALPPKQIACALAAKDTASATSCSAASSSRSR